MLDHVSVFTKTGVVLWSRTMAKLKGTTNPVNTLIADVLREERAQMTDVHVAGAFSFFIMLSILRPATVEHARRRAPGRTRIAAPAACPLARRCGGRRCA